MITLLAKDQIESLMAQKLMKIEPIRAAKHLMSDKLI
ncbi:MAG: hypothetical protein ACJAUP_001368 [Cellvibrionaceae bacterium]|jgi:hypothetical protein